MFKNKNKTGIITAVLLAAVICAVLFSALRSETKADVGGTGEDRFALFRENAVDIGLENADTEYFPGYVHYDPQGFYSDLEKLKELAERNGRQALKKAFKLYDILYAETVSARELYFAADMGASENVKNTAFQDEKEYIAKVSTEMKDRFLTVMSGICTGSNAEAFREHIGNDTVFDSFASYVPLTEKAKELLNREEALKNKYNALNDTVSASAADPESFDYKAANELLGEVFLELVSVRKQIAAEKGYSDYTEYADKEIYSRDYSEAELRPLKEAAKKYGQDINYYTLCVFFDAVMEDADTELILGDVGGTVSSFSEKAAEAYKLLREKRLVSAGFEESRANTEATQGFPEKGSAVIIVKFFQNTEFYNYRTFGHELGHFAHMNTVRNPNPLFTDEGCIDVMELHSTFLETLLANKIGEIYFYPEFYQGFELCSVAHALLSGCYYDDWQREIYKSDRDLTLDEVNALFKEICLDYGIAEYQDMEYEWIWVPHNFLNPLYYISYATSGFAALRLWNEAEDDFDNAVDIWERSLSESPYTEGYMQAVENLGFEKFSEAGIADETLGRIVDDIRTLETAAYAAAESAA